ncbi:50S ribosomal protein L34e [archaeon]|jgi:large subunit ribosomal protein L34e|nr:50S ribosomal protein L34e [archaeon]MBT6761751.1 50S ribosomal protein L34e [archaeon]
MVDGRLKSRRLRRVKVRTPGGKTVMHYRQRKPSAAICAIYGTPLAGVPKITDSKRKNIPKSQRRPERPYGGVLSSKAMRDVIKEQARMESDMGEEPAIESDSTETGGEVQ